MKAQIIYFILFLLVFFFLFRGLSKIISKGLSYDIDKRYLHFRLVIVGVVFSLIAANNYTSSLPLIIVDKVINSNIAGKLFAVVLPSRSFELLYMVLCMLGLNLVYMLSIIVVFAMTKLFCRKNKFIEFEQLAGSERIVHCPWFIVNKFYKDKNGKPTLTNRGFILGIWAKGIKRVFALLWIAEFVLLYWSILWGGELWNSKLLAVVKAMYLLPMAGFVLTEQIQLFLEGPESSETGTFGSVEIEEKMVGEMDTLLYRYREIFKESDIILYSERGTMGDPNKMGLSSNDVGNQLSKDCNEKGILSVITNQIKASGVHQSQTYQNAIVSLLNGNSITVRDYADGEFLVYLCAYLNYYLSQGRSAIVICPDEDDVNDLKETIRAKMTQLNNLDSVWSICSKSEMNIGQQISILVCTIDEMLDIDLKQFSRLAADTFCTVISNSNAFLGVDNFKLGMISSKLRSLQNMERFVFITNEDNASLRTKMKLFLPGGREAVPFSNDARVPKTSIMVWKEESRYKPQLTLGIGGTQSPHLGTALPLAIIASRFDVPKINIIYEKTRGDNDFFNGIFEANNTDIRNYMGTGNDLRQIVRYKPSEAMEQADLKLMVIYDTDYNMFNALWRWMKYGGTNGTLIHVVSPFYMLREYFASNFKRRDMLNSNNEFSALIPHEAVLKRSRLAALLAGITYKGMLEEEIMDVSRKYDWDYPNIVPLLRDALCTVFPSDQVFNIYQHYMFNDDSFFAEKQASFVKRLRVELENPRISTLLKDMTAYAKLSCGQNPTVEIPVLKGNILNYYLPNQIAVFNGSFYRIRSANPDTGLVYAVPAMPDDIPDYYSISEFYMKNYERIDDCIDFPDLDVNICRAEVTRTVYGYVSCSKGNDFYNRANRTISRINGNEGEGEAVIRSNIPVFELNIQKKVFGKTPEEQDANAQKGMLLLAVVLTGLFKTLFPDTYQNLFAVPDMPYDQKMLNNILSNSSDYTFEDLIKVIVPRIKCREAENDDSVVRMYIIEFSCVELGLVDKFYEEKDRILNQVLEYLRWYVASNEAAEKEEKDAEEQAKARAKKAKKAQKESQGAEMDSAPKTANAAEAPAPEMTEAPEPVTEAPAEDNAPEAEAADPGAAAPEDGKQKGFYVNRMIKGTYLNFGADKTPEIFAIKQLIDVIAGVLRNPDKQTAIEPDPDDYYVEPDDFKTVCSFCNREAIFAWQLNDGRCMCSHCHDHQQTQKGAITTLFKNTIAALEHHYHIEFRKDINVRFQSADAIRRAAGGVDNGRIVGFYANDKHQLWIEGKGPSVAMQSTIIHELTHAWQYDNLPMKEVLKVLPKATRDKQMLLMLEGHAVFVELEAMKQFGEVEYEKRLRQSYLQRDDVYGHGYRMVSEYITAKQIQGTHFNSFVAMTQLFNDVIAKEVTIQCPENM